MSEKYPQSLEVGKGRSVPLLVKSTARKRGRLSLRIIPEGVLLTVPARFPARMARAFLQSPDSQKWIRDKIAGDPYLGLMPYTADDDWEVPLAGHIIPVVWHEEHLKRVGVRLASLMTRIKP